MKLRLPWDIYPEGVIAEALKRIPNQDNNSATDKLTKKPSNFALKICGTNEYLLTSRPITQYKVNN